MKYFVYDLIDPRSGVTFYVGKGKGNRPKHHIKEAMSGVQSRKCELIREIIQGGLEVRIAIVERFSCEAKAYDFEAERIAAIGLENLTNVMPGGGGICDPLLDHDRDHVALRVTLEKTARQYGADARLVMNGKVLISLKERLDCSKQKTGEIIERRGVEWVRKQMAARNAELVLV